MPSKVCFFIVMIVFTATSFTSAQYLTDKTSIDRQHEMKSKRAGRNAGDVLLNVANLFISITLNSEFEPVQSERAFKKITILNQSKDSLYVNMVTDVLWKDSTYCDIMGIALPAGAKQKILVPYPAAYNVYFRSPGSEEEKLEIRTDTKVSVFKLQPGMTKEPIEEKSSQ